MYYLYSTNDKPGAKLIRWGGRHKASHFAKYYPGKKLVVESRIDTGVRQIPVKEWLKENRVIFAQEIDLGIADHQLYYLDQTIIGKRYDKKAVLFLAITTFFKKLFTWFPYAENKWGDKDHYFCLEIAGTHRLPLANAGIIIDYDLEQMYPQEFYEILKPYPCVKEVESGVITP